MPRSPHLPGRAAAAGAPCPARHRTEPRTPGLGSWNFKQLRIMRWLSLGVGCLARCEHSAGFIREEVLFSWEAPVAPGGAGRLRAEQSWARLGAALRSLLYRGGSRAPHQTQSTELILTPRVSGGWGAGGVCWMDHGANRGI